MENKFKRFLAVALALFMVVGLLPMNVFAAETEGNASTTSTTIAELSYKDDDGVNHVLEVPIEPNDGFYYGTAENVQLWANRTVYVSITDKSIPGSYCGSGSATPSEDGYYNVTIKWDYWDAYITLTPVEAPKTYVAQIGETKYESLEDAIAAAKSDEVIKLLADITPNSLKIISGKFTIDLNGFTIYGGLNITGSDVELTVTDNSANGEGKIYTGSGIAENYSISISSGTVNITGGSVMGHSYGLIASGDSEVNIIGGSVAGMFTNAVKAVDNSTVNITGGIFYNSEYDLTVATEGNGKVTIKGGTFYSPVAEEYCAEGYVPTENADGTYGVKKVTYVAQIGETKYETLEEAIKAVSKNTPTTIQLLCDYTIASTMVGHQYTQDITIDLGGHTLSNNSIVLTAYRNGTTLTVQNGTIKGNASTGSLRATYGGKIVLGEDLTVAGAGGSAVLVYVDNGSVEIAAKNGVAFTGGKQDFKQSTNVNNKLNVAASIGRTYFGTLNDAIAAAENDDTVTLQNNINVDSDDLVNLDGYHTFFKVEGKSITVDLNGKTVYADASAVTDQFVVGVFSATNNGHLTLTGNGTVQGYSGANQEAAYLNPAKGNTDYNYKFYTLLAVYDDNCSITVNGGNYVLDYAGDSLAYTSCNEGIVVNGGTFKLGNLGGIRNGMPWVFNARGQNVRHVVVNGGSFCADIQHQYYPFEVNVPNTKALKNENGMYTVVDAVAYVTEREWSSAWYTNEVGYATLEEAIAACEGPKTKSNKTSEQEVVVLLKDITLENTITIPAGATVGLDLNGHTVSMSVAATTTSALITNNGTLTIKDSSTEKTGKLTYVSSKVSTSYSTSTIINNGTLTVESGKIENTSARGGAPYAIDNYGTLTVNGGTITATSTTAIRQVQSGSTANTVTVTGGTISGGYAGMQVHVMSNAKKTTTEITGGTFKGTYAFYSTFSNATASSNTEIKVSGGTFDGDVYLDNNNNGSKDLLNVSITDGKFLNWIFVYTKDEGGNQVPVKAITGGTFLVDPSLEYPDYNHYNYVAGGYAAVYNGDGTWIVIKGVSDADELKTALAAGGNVVLTADIDLTEGVTVPAGVTATLYLNGKNITMESAEAVSMITNKGSLTINGTGKIAYTFTGTPNTDVAANTIRNDGVLVVNGGEISNTGTDNQIGYGIDNRNGSTLTVNGGKITATGSSYYDGIRLMCGSNNDTTVTVNDGEISSIWAQNPSTNKATEVKGTVVIKGGNVTTTYYENYTTVKVAKGVTATVTPYGAGSDNTTSAVVDGYTVYSFVH